MAVNGTHNTGEEFKQKSIYRQDTIGTRPATILVGLYNDATDALTEASDIGDITSEPTTGNYARQSLSLDSTDLAINTSSGDTVIDGSVTFDAADTGETIDSFFVIVNFQSSIAGDSSASDHLLLTGEFGQTDLTNYIDITVNISDSLS